MSSGSMFALLLFVQDWSKRKCLGRRSCCLLTVQAGGTQQLALVAPVGRHGSFNAHVAAMATEQRHRSQAIQVL